MRRVLPAMCALVVVVLAGCGRAVEVPIQSSGYKLYEAASTKSDTIVAVIDSRSRTVERSLPFGVYSASWQHLYTASGSRLVDMDPSSGTTLHTLRLPGDFHLPFVTVNGMPGGLSQNGRWLVLQRFDDTPEGPPSATHTLVVDTSYAKAPVSFDLPGYFAFDAVSNDGMRVFLIEYASRSIYRVRSYDVGVGLDNGVVVDKNDGVEAMTGVRLSGVASPDGQWLFSVYARDHKGPFVHALNLDNAIAFCIDLPGSGYASSDGEDGLRWSLAMSADGTHIYAANGALGVVSEISNRSDGNPTLVRSGQLGHPSASAGWLIKNVVAKEMGMGGAVLSPDGRTLVVTGGSGVMWVDTATLLNGRHELDTWRVWGLALSPDGKMLYAVNDAGMIAELSMAGGGAATFGGAPGQPMGLIRVEAVAAVP